MTNSEALMMVLREAERACQELKWAIHLSAYSEAVEFAEDLVDIGGRLLDLLPGDGDA